MIYIGRHKIYLILFAICGFQTLFAQNSPLETEEKTDNFASSGFFTTTAFTKPDHKFHLSSREIVFLSANYPISENTELSLHTLMPPFLPDGILAHFMAKTTLSDNTSNLNYAILLNFIIGAGDLDMEKPILGCGGVITVGDFDQNLSFLGGAGSDIDGEIIKLLNISGQYRVSFRVKLLIDFLAFSTTEEPISKDTIFIGAGMRLFWDNTCLDLGFGRGTWGFDDMIGIPFLRLSVNL